VTRAEFEFLRQRGLEMGFGWVEFDVMGEILQNCR